LIVGVDVLHWSAVSKSGFFPPLMYRIRRDPGAKLTRTGSAFQVTGVAHVKLIIRRRFMAKNESILVLI